LRIRWNKAARIRIPAPRVEIKPGARIHRHVTRRNASVFGDLNLGRAGGGEALSELSPGGVAGHYQCREVWEIPALGDGDQNRVQHLVGADAGVSIDGSIAKTPGRPSPVQDVVRKTGIRFVQELRCDN